MSLDTSKTAHDSRKKVTLFITLSLGHLVTLTKSPPDQKNKEN